MTSPTDRLGDREALIRIHHGFHLGTNCFTHGSEPLRIFTDVRFTDLYFYSPKAARLVSQRVVDHFGNRKMQPPALRIVYPDFLLRASRHDVQREPSFSAAHVPQCRVDRTERKTGDGTDRSGMGVEEQILPDLFDHGRIAPKQLRSQMIADKRDDRGTPSADRIGISGSFRVVIRV